MQASWIQLNSDKIRLLRDFKNFSLSEDFTIKIDEKEFKVHKLILAARSPTIAEMIENNLDANELNLVDLSVEIFEKILEFIYVSMKVYY